MDKEWISPELVWFVVGVVFFLLEMALPGIILVFFAIGAWIAALASLFFDISLNTQLTIFLVASIVSLVVLRKKLKATLTGRVRESNQDFDDFDELIGTRAVVVKAIEPGELGKVEVHGTDWDAEADEAISIGANVEITQKKGLTLSVKPL